MARIERYGVLGTEHDGIFFTESALDIGQSFGQVKAVSNRQNTSLDSLKSKLARQAMAKDCNCIASFKYSQRATVFSFSSTQLTATGTAVRM